MTGTTIRPDRLERALPFVVGLFTVSVAAISMLRGGMFVFPDLLSVFMATSGIAAAAVSLRPENRRIRAWGGAALVLAYLLRAVYLLWHAAFDHHPETAVYWYGITLGVVIYVLLAILLWVVWTRVIMPWGEVIYQQHHYGSR